jgi:integrase
MRGGFRAWSVSTPAGRRLHLTRGNAVRLFKAHVAQPSTGQESDMEGNATSASREPWNKGKIVGQKAPFKLKDIWELRVRLQMAGRVRELALFDLGIDSKLRACDLVRLRVRDISHGDQVASRAIVMQQKTQRPVQFEITPPTREAVQKWIKEARLKPEDYLFRSRIRESPHLGPRQYARVLDGWVEELGLDPADYGTHSMRRTKATLIYRRTKNLRAVQLLLGHSKLDEPASTRTWPPTCCAR